MPEGYEISQLPRPGMLTFVGKLVSWEEAMGVERQDLRPGMEKFSAPEGSRLVLTRPGEAPYYFAIPTRSLAYNIEFAQPLTTLPM